MKKGVPHQPIWTYHILLTTSSSTSPNRHPVADLNKQSSYSHLLKWHRDTLTVSEVNAGAAVAAAACMFQSCAEEGTAWVPGILWSSAAFRKSHGPSPMSKGRRKVKKKWRAVELSGVQSMLIIRGFCMDEFAYLLTFICNRKDNTGRLCSHWQTCAEWWKADSTIVQVPSWGGRKWCSAFLFQLSC